MQETIGEDSMFCSMIVDVILLVNQGLYPYEHGDQGGCLSCSNERQRRLTNVDGR
jgi:hypothetical protein